MDRLINHLFDFGIPGFFLAVALLYELAISLKLKFGRSWLYKEIRDNLQNPAARKLLLHDLRSRPSAANRKYVSFLLKSHDWLNYYLDSTRNFNQRTLLWWRQRISLRRRHQYLTGRSLAWCFALATLYPIVLFLLRFAISGNFELTSQGTLQFPGFERWLLLLTYIASGTILFMLSSGILPRLLKSALSHRMSGHAFIWSTIGICIILLFFSLLYSELIINKPAFTLALISAAMFSFYCVVLTARYESLLRSLLTPFIFVLIFILFYVLSINILKILDFYTYFSSGISLALVFFITLIATHFVAGYIVRAQKSANVLGKP